MCLLQHEFYWRGSQTTIDDEDDGDDNGVRMAMAIAVVGKLAQVL